LPSTQQANCAYCKGAKAIQGTLGVQKCPICDGTGVNPRSGLFYTYRMAPVALLANQVGALSILTIVNWDFEWLEFTGESTGAFTVLFTDLGAARQFSNIAIHSAEILGNGQNPFPLLSPYVFGKQSQIQIQLNDVSANPNTVALAFIGRNLGEGQHQ
jgi:hypothetical protein